MHEWVSCRWCGEAIGPEHWRLFEHATCRPGQGPQARRQWEALQAEARSLQQGFQQRGLSLADMRLHSAGVRVTRAEER
jgi:hypothetical protein